MTLNKLPGQVPGGLIWKAFAIAIGLRKRRREWLAKWERGYIYSKKRGVRRELMK